MSDPMRPSARPTAAALLASARLFARRRLGRALVAAALVAVALASVSRAGEDAREARRAWGTSDAVWVSSTDIAAGSTVMADAVTLRSLPRAALPDDAVTDSPIGLRAAVALAPGEILRDARLAAGGQLAAQLRPGEGAIALPGVAPHLAAGDLVDLHALLTGERVTSGARVLQVDDGTAIVAVVGGELAALVRTFTTGDVVAVVVG